MNGSDGLYNPRIKSQYYFNLVFEACSSVADSSVHVTLIYTAEETFVFELVRSSFSSQLDLFMDHSACCKHLPSSSSDYLRRFHFLLYTAAVPSRCDRK